MRMPILLLALLLAVGCKGDSKEEPATTGPARTAPPPKPVTYPEPEVVGILHAIDSARIAPGMAVRNRSQSESILEYARVVRIDHRAMRTLLDSILGSTNQTPAENAIAQQLRGRGEQFVAELIALDTGFNNTYIRREVEDHEQALALIDTVLIRSATTPALKQALERLRPAYAAHLQMAQEIKRLREEAAARRAAAPPPPAAPPPRVADTPSIRVDTLITTTGQ